MASSPDAPAAREAARGLVARHGRPLAAIGAISVVGIFATAGFQVVASRGLGPELFGLIAALLALVNVASIGSSALRNAVAVNVASAPKDRTGNGRDPSIFEALLLGGVAVAALLALSPWILPGAEIPEAAFVLTLSALIPYFLFARAQGILQGVGRSMSVVWWSTGAQLIQLALTIVVVTLAIGAGVTGVMAAVFIAAVSGALGATLQARRVGLAPRGRAFTRESVTVLLLTVMFAWLTNSDVIFVRIWDDAADGGNYAAAAILVKTTLILPTTLSLYLLPRFVQSRDDLSSSNRGVLVILGATLIGGLAVFLTVFFFSPAIVEIIFGGAYESAATILPALALSWIPWALAQAMLIRVVAMASASALVIMMITGVAQVLVGALALPDTLLFITLNGFVGGVLFVGMLIAHLRGRSISR